MASGESQSPLKGPKLSASSSSSRNDYDETPWMLLPNNLEINSRSKPSKKQRNKEKLRGFPEDRVTANMTERLSSSPVGFQNFTRAKCNTASWLKDQLVNEKKTRKRTCDSEEVFSDAELAQSHSGALNFPASHSIDVPEHLEDLPRPQSRRSIIENENTKSVKEECIKNETDSAIVFERLSQLQDFISEATSLCQDLEINDEPVMKEEFGKIKKAVKQVADGEREHKMLLQQMVSENGAYAMNGISPSSSGSKASNCSANISYRDSNGSTAFCSEEEHNKCNHLLEKMKQSEERLMSLKMQESFLYSMQKKGENKLATFEALDQIHPDDQDETSSEGFWNVEAASEQRQWLAEKTLQAVSLNEEETQLCSWNEPQDIKQLHVSLERIRKRVQSMQQNPDIKNMTRSLSSDDCEIGERVAAVEFERKKLKNKLLELQEKKKMNDELLQELSFLKDAAHAVSLDAVQNDDGTNFASASSSLSASLKDKIRHEHSLADADRKLYKLQSTLRDLEGMMKTITPVEIIQNESSGNDPIEAAMPRMEIRNMRSGTCNKRDNVRKEINSGFPARRHYEAEGRANEDADIPPLPTSSQPPNLARWREFSKMQEQLRKLQVAEKHVKVINDIMNSIREAKKLGIPVKDEHLQLLSSLNESEKEQSSSNSEEEMEYVSESVPVDSNPVESFGTDIKEVSSDADNCSLQQVKSKLSETQKHAKLRKDVMSSLRECARSGKSMPIEHLRVLVDLHKDSDCESDSEIDSEAMIRENSPSESGLNRTKVESSLLQTGDHKQEDISSLGAYNTEFVAGRKKDFLAFVSDCNQCAGVPTSERNKKSSGQLKELSTFQSQLQSLIRMSSDGRNEDIRSSGEGGYVPNRNSENKNPLDHVQPVRPLRHHQDNLLLTRQNVATMESQNQNCSRNLHSRGQSSKKDNINNLSGKMEKLSIQNSMNGPFAQIVDIPKDNIDSVSTLSSELNQSRSGETERKTIIDILTCGKKKQAYDRNRDNHIHSNSSIDSEPLECSNSALAVDTTVAATWGESSTQENFEDEAEEPSRNIRRQHRLEGASGSSYHPVPKLKKISKMGPVRGTTSGSSFEIPNSASCSSETNKDYQQQISTNFIQQLRKQINQLNALCQEELLNEGPQTSMNFHQNSNPNLLPSCQPLHAANDIIHPYNQQLLLCLSQCYHTLYLQQLEIQNLHRYIRHNIDSEVIHQANNLNSQGNNGEDFEFRPWCVSASSNPLMPSNMYPNDQVSPRPTTYLQLPMKSYPPHSAPVAGTRPVRAVIHPASQENRAVQETLNNQVPPRTRANNFWDNFRSYSRQNLLSTSNNAKRNENIGLPVAPQIRQVHPMVSNGNMNSGPELTNSLSSSLPSDLNRSTANPDRHLPNQHGHDIPVALNPSKKPNASAPAFGQGRYSAMHKKDSVANMNSSGVRNLRSEHYRAQGAESSHTFSSSNPSSVNLIQLQAIPDESKVGTFSSICPTSGTDSASSHSSSDAQNSHLDYSDFLIGLYKETKALKSDVQRQQALKMIREIAISEKSSDNEFTGNCKIRNDHAVPSSKSERAASAPVAESSFTDTSANTSDAIDADKPSSRLSETNLPWLNQNLPTAAISPLSKQATPRPVSTGAVRKKTKLQSTCFWDSLSNAQTSANNSQENETTSQEFNVSSLLPIRESNSDFPDFPRNIVESIIHDLHSDLPFSQMKEDSSDSFWSSVNAYIISRIRANMSMPLPHKSLASLRQSLDHLTSEMKFCYNETDFLKCVSQLLYDSLTSFMSTGRFTTSPPYISLPDGSSVLDSNDKTQELSIKMPADIDDKTRELSINMPPDDVFLPQFQTVLPQNIISTTETEDNINNMHPICTAASEEEVKCEWEPEAETEPEVEAGTEADLAEADQSPGQQGNISSTSLPVADSWSIDQSSNTSRSGTISVNTTPSGNVAENTETVDTTEVILGAHCCPDSCVDQETVLDDIPTKLCSTEEEPEKLEEPSSQLPSDNTEENNELFPESSSENEVTSTK